MPVSYREVEGFRAVMLTGSMSQAAKMLRISQPGISRLIANLERATQLRLFVRGSPILQPTAEALLFYREVEKTFTGLHSLDQIAQSIRAFGDGHLRIACLPSLTFGFLPRVVQRLLKSRTGIKVTLQARNSDTILDWAAAGQCDVGIVTPMLNRRTTVASRPLMSLSAVCILPLSHPLAGRDVIVPEDLEDQRFISLDPNDATRKRVDEVFEAARVRRRLTLETQYTATVCNCVAQGLGVSIVNPFVAYEYNGCGVVSRPFMPEIAIETTLLLPERAKSNELVGVFVRMLEDLGAEQVARMQESLRWRGLSHASSFGGRASVGA
jgi:DNA-binding transcriptional LysR family regulator